MLVMRQPTHADWGYRLRRLTAVRPPALIQELQKCRPGAHVGPFDGPAPMTIPAEDNHLDPMATVCTARHMQPRQSGPAMTAVQQAVFFETLEQSVDEISHA